MKSSRFLLLLICFWILVQIWSFWASSAIEGPKNIDTGFKRLDVWFQWQLVALGIAVVSAIFGFISSGKRLRNRIFGLAPLGITLLFAVGVFLFASYGPISERDGQAGAVNSSAPKATTQTAD